MSITTDYEISPAINRTGQYPLIIRIVQDDARRVSQTIHQETILLQQQDEVSDVFIGYSILAANPVIIQCVTNLRDDSR